MSLIVNEGSSHEHSPLAEGTYTAICYQMIDLGLQYNERFENSSRKVRIGWEIPEVVREYEGETYTSTIGKTYTASLNSKSQLRKDIVSWRGKDFSAEELKAFDLRKIIGVPCLIQIVHTERDGKKYANIAGLMRLPRGMAAPVATRAAELYDIDEDDPEKINEFPDWLQETIRNSESYVARLESMKETAPVADPIIDELDDGDGELPF